MILQSTIVFSQTWEEKSSGTDYILFDISIPSGQNNVAYVNGHEDITIEQNGQIKGTTMGHAVVGATSASDEAVYDEFEIIV